MGGLKLECFCNLLVFVIIILGVKLPKIVIVGVIIRKRAKKMTSGFFICEFEDCPFYGRVMYVEKPFFKRHLVLNHGFDNLLRFAFKKGIIEDVYRCPSMSFVINKVAEICQVRRS